MFRSPEKLEYRDSGRDRKLLFSPNHKTIINNFIFPTLNYTARESHSCFCTKFVLNKVA